jgi:tetratricopeptide (TPR) repeat protein
MSTKSLSVHRFSRSVALVLALLAAFTVSGQTDPTSVDTSRIKTLIDARHYQEAVAMADRAEDSASSPKAKFDLAFLKGTAWQELAGEARQSQAERTRAFAEAQRAYERAAELQPSSLATLNNLAVLYASANRDAEARQYYQRAVSTAAQQGDPNLETYALNFADFLRDRDGQEAIRQATIALKAPNSGAESRDLLVDLYSRYQPSQLLPFARTLLDEGRTARVRDLAVDYAAKTTVAPDLRRDWFSLIALSIARDTLGTKAFDPQPTLARLNQIAGDDPFNVPARQLAVAIREPPGRASPLGWWLEGRNNGAIRISNRAAMLELLMSLGQKAWPGGAPGDPKRAILCFQTAIEFGDRGPDPEAFLALVNVYADVNDRASLRALMDRYQYELFTEKGDAYARGDWPLIFRLHTALGMTYAHLNVWRDAPTEVQTALFQLEHAQHAANELNRRETAAGRPPKYSLPPAAVQKLAEGYRAVGRDKDATRVKIESAEQLVTGGRVRESAQLVNSIKPAELNAADPNLRQKYQKVEAAVRMN